MQLEVYGTRSSFPAFPKSSSIMRTQRITRQFVQYKKDATLGLCFALYVLWILQMFCSKDQMGLYFLIAICRSVCALAY